MNILIHIVLIYKEDPIALVFDVVLGYIIDRTNVILRVAKSLSLHDIHL